MFEQLSNVILVHVSIVIIHSLHDTIYIFIVYIVSGNSSFYVLILSFKNLFYCHIQKRKRLSSRC